MDHNNGMTHNQALANYQTTNQPGAMLYMPSVTDISAPLTIDEKTLPETITSPLYTPGFMRTQLGNLMCVELLVGDKLELRTGYLVSVGAGYILLGATDGSHTTLCDMYSIKFVNIMTPYMNGDHAMPLQS